MNPPPFTRGQSLAIAVLAFALARRPGSAVELRVALWRCFGRRGDAECEQMWGAVLGRNGERLRRKHGLP